MTRTARDKLAALVSLRADLEAREADYHAASEDATDVLAALIEYVEGPLPVPDSLAAAAYAFLAGYEHATGDTAATRPVYAALRKAGLDE